VQTPSLRAVRARAPYLHDGRAATIEEAIRMDGAEPTNDLLLYLESL
jgi:cytochrome c peroxidase